jgi:hypothetical protein
VSRVIGFVYCSTFYVASFLSALSIVMFFGGVAAVDYVGARSHCAVPFGMLAIGRSSPATLVSPIAERCGSSKTRVSLVIRS